MNVTLEQTKKILLGDIVFSQLGFSLMITRLKRTYSDSPDNSVLLNCMNEINAFLTKYNAIMEKDYFLISKL